MPWLQLVGILLVEVFQHVNVLTWVAVAFYSIMKHDPMFELVGDAVVNVYENHDEKIAFLQLKEQTKQWC